MKRDGRLIVAGPVSENYGIVEHTILALAGEEFEPNKISEVAYALAVNWIYSWEIVNQTGIKRSLKEVHKELLPLIGKMVYLCAYEGTKEAEAYIKDASPPDVYRYYQKNSGK